MKLLTNYLNNRPSFGYLLLLVLTTLVSIKVSAQITPQLTWGSQIYISNTQAYYNGSGITPLTSKTDPLGNTYVIGSFKGIVDLDPGVNVVNATSTNAGGLPTNWYSATYLVKFDKYGNYVWSHAFTSNAGSQNWPEGIDFTPQGKIFVTGVFSGQVTIAGTAVGGGGNSSVYLAQINPNGTLHSANKLQGTSVFSPFLPTYKFTNIQVHASKIDEDGNIIIAGAVSGDAGGNGIDIDITTATVVSYERGNYFIAKYDTGYNLLSHKKITFSIGNTLRVDQIETINDTIFVQGYSDQPSANFNGATPPVITPLNNGNYFTAAYTSNNLNCIWAFKLDVEKQAINVNPTGGLAYAWQATTNRFDIDPTADSLFVNGGQYYANIFMAHFNTSNGTLIKTGTKAARRITDSLTGFNAIRLGDFRFTPSGAFYIGGSATGTGNIDFDPGVGVANVSSNMNSGYDMFMAKYNPDLSYNFARVFAHSDNGSSESINNIEVIDENTFVVSAVSKGNGLNMDLNKNAPVINSGTFDAGVYAKYTNSSNNINITTTAKDTVESCNISASLNVTPANPAYTYQWYFNGNILTADTTTSIFNTTVGSYQCLIKNNTHQQWSKKILYTSLVNITENLRYPLDGSANNQLSSSNHGVATAITYVNDRNGIANSAALFNGTSSEITISTVVLSSTNAGVSLWFKRANLTNRAMSLVSLQAATPGAWNPVLYIDSTGRLSGRVATSTPPIYSSAVVLDTNWHHAAWTYDASKGKQIIYFDGEEVGSSPSAAIPINIGNILKFGNGYLSATTLANVGTTSNSNYFAGSIDQVRISNTIKPGNALQLFNEIIITGSSPDRESNGRANVCVGYPVTTSIYTANSNLTYQWYYNNGVIQANDTNFIGVGTNSFTIKNMPAGNLFGHYAFINDDFCNTLGYIGVPLTGVTTSSILSQPSNQTTCIGGNTFFVAKASAAKNYLWKKNGSPIANSNNDTLYLNNVTNNDFGNYTCDITSCSDSIVTTNSANLSQFQLAITTQPVSQLTCTGSTVKFKVVTNSSTATYQWKKDGVNIPNANLDSLVISSVQPNSFGAYTVSVGGCLNTINSDTANLTQRTNFTAINNADLRLHLTLNGNTTDLTGLNTATNVGTIAYVNDRNNATNAAADFNATTYVSVNHSANLAFTNTISIAFWVNPKTHNDCRFIDKSAGNTNNFLVDQLGTTLRVYIAGKSLIINELPPLNSWTHITATYLASGTLKVYYNGALKGSTAGANATLTSNTNGLLIGAVQGATCKVNALMDDVRIYARELTVNDINTLISTNGEIGFISPAQNICEGANLTTEVRTASNLSYQWYKNGVIIPGAIMATYTKNNALVSDSGTYSCDVFSANCIKQTVTTGKVTINPKPTIINQPVNTSACANGNIQLSVTALGIGNTYRWLKNGVAMTNGGNIAGVTTNTLSISFISNNEAAAYRCVISNSCGTDTTNVANVTINTGLQITQQPTNVSACANTNARVIVVSNDQNATYVWRRNGVAIANSNNDTLTLTNVTAANAGNYQVFITSNCGSDSSAVVSLTINANTQITTQPLAKTSCGGQGFTLTTSATGANLSFQWKLNGTNLNNENGISLTRLTTTPTDTGNYTVLVNGTCGSVTSNIAKVNIATPISIVTQPDTILNACSSDAGITTNVSASGSIFGYQWFINNSIINNNAQISGATTNRLTFNGNGIASGNLTCKIYGACDTLTTKVINFNYYTAPAITTQPVSKSICEGDHVSFKVSAIDAVSYKWYLDNVLRTDITNKIIGSNTDSITILNATIADIGDNNAPVRVELTGRCPNQTTVSNAVLLIFNPDLSITSQSAANTNTCVASNLLLYINTNSNATYVWKKNGAVISNQTNDTLLINGVTNNDAGTYTCEATSTCGNLTSDSMLVAVSAALTPTITQAGNALSTQTFNTYQWYKNGVLISGANAQNYNATESGLYSVFVSNTGGCNARSATYNFTFVGLNEILNLNQLFSVYPNPTSNNITINVDGVNSQWNIKLLDIAGSEILSTQMNYQTTINVETLAKGVYIIRATNSDGQQANIRFVKN